MRALFSAHGAVYGAVIIVVLTLAVVASITVYRPHRHRETFIDYKALAELTRQSKQQEEPPWDDTDAEIFVTFVSLWETPPTDVVMRHYRHIKSRDRLSSIALRDRMQKDLPKDDEEGEPNEE